MTILKSRIHDASSLTIWVCYFPARVEDRVTNVSQGTKDTGYQTPFGNYYHSGASTVQIIGFNSFLQLTLLAPWYRL